MIALFRAVSIIQNLEQHLRNYQRAQNARATSPNHVSVGISQDLSCTSDPVAEFSGEKRDWDFFEGSKLDRGEIASSFCWNAHGLARLHRQSTWTRRVEGDSTTPTPRRSTQREANDLRGRSRSRTVPHQRISRPKILMESRPLIAARFKAVSAAIKAATN